MKVKSKNGASREALGAQVWCPSDRSNEDTDLESIVMLKKVKYQVL